MSSPARTRALLALLAVQNVASSLLVEVSRKLPGHSRYSPAAAVLCGELLKLLLSLALLLGSGERLHTIVLTLLRLHPLDHVRLAVPAAVYTVQNNLVFLALQHINSATFQVFSQLKVLSTAVFSVTFLNRRLHRVQWIALVILVIGVSLAHMPAKSACPTSVAAAATPEPVGAERHAWVGISAVCLLTLLSGFAGVYQERIVKRNMELSIHYLNIQMACLSVATNVISVLVQDGLALWHRGFFAGFTALTVAVVVVQSVGGLLVSLVIRHASNLAKSYVVSVAIFATGGISFLFLDFQPDLSFALGAALVVCSVLLYNEPDRWKRERTDGDAVPHVELGAQGGANRTAPRER